MRVETRCILTRGYLNILFPDTTKFQNVGCWHLAGTLGSLTQKGLVVVRCASRANAE
jgi:hypothetical protein